MRRFIVALLFGATNAQIGGAQIGGSWLPDTFTFLGNTVRGRQPSHLLVALDMVYQGKFAIAVGESADDGRSWHFGPIAAHDPARDLWDPAMARLPDGTLLLEYHGGGGMTIIRSTDDGSTWQPVTMFRGGDGEGYWQPLPPDQPGGPTRLALFYGNSVNHVIQYEIRTTTDGRHWSDPVPVGAGGAIWDAMRAGLGPVESDSGGIMHVVYPNRPADSDSETILMATLDVRTLRPRGAPIVIARLTQRKRGVAVFPVLAECADGDHVIFSEVRGPRSALEEITVHHDGTISPTQTFVERGQMLTGWGRVWFVPSWSGTPQISWVELPNGPHSRVYSIPRPDLAHCAY